MMSIALLESIKTQIRCTTWPYALQHATLIKNIVPHSALPDGTSPYQLWTGNKPSVSMICTFGCKATLAIPEKHHDKLSSCSITSIHLRLIVGKKVFIIYNPTTCKIHELHDIHFFEGTTDSEQVMIKIPMVESLSHVVDDEMIGLDDGVEAGGDGVESDGEKVEAGGDDDAGAEVLSGQTPIEP